MSDMTKIEEAAKQLGELIADHPAAKSYAQASEALGKDVTTQRLVNDFNRLLQKLGEKQASGQPIEVAEKRQLEQLQTAVMTHPMIGRLQQAQMDYLDVLRKAMTLVSQTAGGQEAIEDNAAAGVMPGAGGPMPGAGAGGGLVY